MSLITATDFNQRPSEIKAMCELEPVFITDRGRTTAVVLSIAEYERLQDSQQLRSLGAALVADDDIEFETTRDRSLGRVPDFEG